MTDSATPTPLTSTTREQQMFPTLTPAQIARIAAHGGRRRVAAGEVLVETGAHHPPFFVVHSGRLEVVRPSETKGEEPVAVHAPGQFTGEVNMLSGRRGLVRIRATVAGEVIQVGHEELLALVRCSRPACRACSPSATCAAATSSAWPPPSAKDRSPSPSSTAS